MTNEKSSKPNRGLKNRTSFGNAVDTRLYIAFKAHSTATKIPMSKMMDEAVELYLIKHNIKY